jgi:hypothetical protein
MSNIELHEIKYCKFEPIHFFKTSILKKYILPTLTY